jgi:hypothetical protein
MMNSSAAQVKATLLDGTTTEGARHSSYDWLPSWYMSTPQKPSTTGGRLGVSLVTLNYRQSLDNGTYTKAPWYARALIIADIIPESPLPRAVAQLITSYDGSWRSPTALTQSLMINTDKGKDNDNNATAAITSADNSSATDNTDVTNKSNISIFNDTKYSMTLIIQLGNTIRCGWGSTDTPFLMMSSLFGMRRRPPVGQSLDCTLGANLDDRTLSVCDLYRLMPWGHPIQSLPLPITSTSATSPSSSSPSSPTSSASPSVFTHETTPYRLPLIRQALHTLQSIPEINLMRRLAGIRQEQYISLQLDLEIIGRSFQKPITVVLDRIGWTCQQRESLLSAVFDWTTSEPSLSETLCTVADAVAFLPEPLLVLYAMVNKLSPTPSSAMLATTGIVIDIGTGSTRITPIHGGRIIWRGIRHSFVGSHTIDIRLALTLRNSDGHLVYSLPHGTFKAIETIRLKCVSISPAVSTPSSSINTLHKRRDSIPSSESMYTIPDGDLESLYISPSLLHPLSEALWQPQLLVSEDHGFGNDMSIYPNEYHILGHAAAVSRPLHILIKEVHPFPSSVLNKSQIYVLMLSWGWQS